jgi:hypothetical protein
MTKILIDRAAVEQALAPKAEPTYPLPDDLYPGSKDWVHGSYAERVQWLHMMYEAAKEQLELYAAPQPKAEPQGPVGTYEEVMQTMRSLQTGTLVAQQQMFALLKDKPLYAAPPAPEARKPRQPLTDEEINELLPEPDGTAEANKVKVAGGLGYEYDEVDAWSKPLVMAVARAVEAAVWGDGK